MSIPSLMNQLVQGAFTILSKQSATQPSELFDVCTAITQLIQTSHRLYTLVSVKRGSFAKLPSMMLLHVARYNQAPSLLTLSRTCKSWFNVFNKADRCRLWVKSAFGEAAQHIPLQEFCWLSIPIPVPKHDYSQKERIQSLEKNQVFSTAKSYPPQPDCFHKVHHTNANQEWHYKLPTKVSNVHELHLCGDQLYILSDPFGYKHETGQYCLWRIMRGPHRRFDTIAERVGSLELDVITRYESKICTWSSEHFFWVKHSNLFIFKLSNGARVVDRDIKHVFHKSFSVHDIYMTWHAGYLILGMCVKYQSFAYCELIVYDWDKDAWLFLVAREFAPHVWFNHLLAAFQLHGEELVYLGFGDDHQITVVRSSDLQSLKKRKPHEECVCEDVENK